MDRFETKYGVNSEHFAQEQVSNQYWRTSALDAKGDNWYELFGDETNMDDDSKTGVPFQMVNNAKRVSNKVSVKLYSEFTAQTSSWLCLGLKMVLSNRGNNNDDWVST